MKRVSPKLAALDLAAWSRHARRHWFAVSIGAGVLAAIAIGYLMGERRFSNERVETLKEIDTYVSFLSDASSKVKARPELDKKLQSMANLMLGPSLETVDSEVRRRLNRACEELGLNDFSVTTGTSVGRQTPAKKEFRTPEARKLRDEIDFMEVQATVMASGPVEKIYRLLFRIDAEPWIKRIESLRFNPTGDGQFVRMTVKLTTPFMPGTSSKTTLTLDPARLQQADRYAALFASNPFRIPAPPPTPPAAIAANVNPAVTPTPAGESRQPAPPPPPVPTPPGGFPYGEWQITGIVEGPSGPEAWLRHVPTGTNLALLPGTPVGELVFRRVEYDFAVFDSPAGACRIQVGTNLTQRSAVVGTSTNG